MYSVGSSEDHDNNDGADFRYIIRCERNQTAQATICAIHLHNKIISRNIGPPMKGRLTAQSKRMGRRF